MDEGVWCWGHGINVSNSIGYGGRRIHQSKIPRLMSKAADAIEVAAGKNFTCVLLATGRVSCWGDNRHNQLGGRGLVKAATQITAGDNHGCALLEDSSVECWGRYYSDKGTKQYIEGGAKQISAGAMHTCVLMEDGTIQCGGSFANLTKGTSRNDFVGVASGYHHACGWTSEGQVYCWGKTDFQALGAKVKAKEVHEPTLVAGVTGARRVSLGAAFACAVLETGEVQCWGHDGYGQQGVRSSSGDKRVPVTNLKRAVEVAAGGRHVCARTDDDNVFCWGDNNWGELGNGTTGRNWLPQRALFPDSKPKRSIAVSTSEKRHIRLGKSPGQRVQYNLDSVAELQREGWTRRDSGTSIFDKGILTIHSNGGEGWRLERKRASGSSWWRNAGNDEGWAVEARVRVDPASPPVSKHCTSGGPGLLIHDGFQALRLLITKTSLRLGTVKGQAFPVAATSGYHTYRIERNQHRLRILIDGKEVFERIGPRAQAASRDNYLKFGDLGCSRATSYWDYFAYETGVALPVTAKRGDWHTGAKVDKVLATLDSSLPKTLRGPLKSLRLPQSAARCVAVIAMDYAARDVLPKAWTAIGEHGNRNLFTSSKALSDPSARSFLARAMARHIEPQRCAASDRRCRQNPPRPEKTPPGYHSLLSGLKLSTEWALHPKKVYESMEETGSVFGGTIGSVPGVEASAKAMIKKIASLRKSISPSCNLSK